MVICCCLMGVLCDTLGQTVPTPTKEQLALQDMEMYAFIHYALNT